MENKEVLLKVKDLSVFFGRGKKKFKAVNDVNFEIYKGETFGLVGESGSGKTTIGRAIMRIYPSTGDIIYDGDKINGKISKSLDKEIINKIQMFFQDPNASLNERSKVEYIVSEGLYGNSKFKNQDKKSLVSKTLESVSLLPEFINRFPHEFSGGQKQRIGIARSLVMEPEFIVADEPISALDVSIRAQVLNLLKKIQEEKGLTYLFIAHDLSIVRYFTDRIAVIYKGEIVELCESERLFEKPLHPYTKALMSAIPQPNPNLEKEKKVEVYNPSLHDYSTEKPTFREVENGHFVMCNSVEELAYKEVLISGNK